MASKPPPATSRFWKAVGGVTRTHVALFRLTKGRIGGRAGKITMLILDHRGRKSGAERSTPLFYRASGPDLVLIASKGGTGTHPAWFHNLMAMERAEVELPGGEKRVVRPRVAEGAEREELWALMVEMYKTYDDYAEFAAPRQIPVVVLEPAA